MVFESWRPAGDRHAKDGSYVALMPVAVAMNAEALVRNFDAIR
jgi:hypothetical protein